jgi:nucleobindin
MREREEEMERMREHVFKESDLDKNRLISFDEFLAETKRDEFDKDPGKMSLLGEKFVWPDEKIYI